MKKEMSNEFIGFYKIMIPLIDSNLNNQYHPIYFTPKTKFPKYQYKYYQMKGYHISDEFLSNKIIETLQMHAILLQSTSEKEFFPIFRLMTTKEFDHTFEFFSKNTDLNNYYYTLGMINEKKLNFVKAREFFEKGCQQSEMFSLLKMVRILSEPFLAGKFQTKANYEHALDLTLQNFFNNGLFDCFTPNSESFYGIYLLYLYLDCFPEMVTVSLKTSLKNPLLKLLMSENWKKAEIYTLLQEIEIQYSEKSLLLGDLYHPKILGVNIETEFNKMQDKYTKGLRNNNKSWLKVACLNENFLNFELKRQSKVKANHILDDSINRINKNIETAYKRLESFPEYGCNFELLQYQASNFNKKALEISHLEYYRNLTQFGDESILRVFFKVLKFQMKKVDQIIMKEELTNELFMIAMKIYQTDNDFKEAPLAFCLEKGLGVKKNFPAAFNLYKDILKKIITSGFEIHFFCYRFASLLKASGYSDLEEYSTFFFQVSYWSLISSINEEDFNGFYELGKMYLKGRGIDANEGYSIKIYEALLRNVKEKKRDSLNDHILIQLLSKKIGKLKKTGPSALKNTSESDTLKELISKEKHNSNKTIKNWPIYKSLSSGGSITSEILNTLNVLNEKFKTLKIVNTEEWSSKVSFPFSKAFIQIKGSIKSKEMIKDNEEPPKWRSSMKNSLKYKIEDFTAYIKDCLSNYLHCFELHEFQLNLHEKKIIGNHILHPAKIKCNSQIFSVQILELGDLTLSQEKILLLLEKLEPYIKISSPYFLNIIGFSLILNPKAQIYIFYENFSETLTDFIDQQDSSPPISSKYFFWLLFIVQTFQNSGYLFSYLTEANFILTKTLIPKLVDLDYEILNRQIKQTMTIETSRANTFFNLAKGSIPPEILYGVMKNNKSTLSIGSVAWSLGIIGFGLFSKKQLFEGVEIKNYDDFKTFFNQEKIEAKLESFLNGEEILKVLKVLLNMNQQDRTNINLQEIWSQNPQGNQVEFPDENYLIINGFLHVNFDKADSADQEIYLPHKEYFRGECQSNLPNGKCQFNSGNFSMKGEFSKGKFIGKGDLFNTLSSSLLEFGQINPQGSIRGSLKKLSFFEEIEIPLEFSVFGMNLNEKLFEKLIAGYISNEELGSSFNTELDDSLKWELIVKFMISYKGFNKKETTKFYSIDNVIMFMKNGPDGNCQEFVQFKCHYVSPYILLYDEKISTKNALYVSFFSIGLFQLSSKPKDKISLSFLLQNINGVKYTFPGTKEMGVFSDFELNKGFKIHDYKVFETFDSSKKVFFSRINDSVGKFKYEGLKKNQMKWYQGTEIYSNNWKYEGGFEEGKHSGKGVLTDFEGKIVYKGYFANGVPSWGLFYKEKTKKFEGSFIQVDGFFSGFEVRSIDDLLNNFELSGTYLSPEEKIISTKGKFPLKDPLSEMTGYFTLIYDSLNEYEGYLSQGLKKGFGIYNIKKEENVHISIQGIWEANKVKAAIYWDSQNSFKKSIGNFSFNDNGNYTMQDFGLLYFKNGNKYEGMLLNNKLQGFGEFEQNFNGLLKGYRGEFSQSLRNGYGILEDLDLQTREKMIYTGNFYNNKKSGFGMLRFKENLFLEGNFIDNSIKFGCVYLKNHLHFDKIYANLIKKQNKDNEFSATGYGLVCLKDGRQLECEVTNILEEYLLDIIGKITLNKNNKVYEGMLKGLKPNGIGELYKNGKLLYSGQFLDGKFNGIGKLKLANEREYVGEFQKGVKDGFGMEFDFGEKKYVFKGYWKHGIKEKKGVQRNLNKQQFISMKKNGIKEVLIDL